MSTNQPPTPILDLVKKEAPTFEKILSLSTAPGVDIPTIAQQELGYLELISQSKPDLLQCTSQSIILALKGVMRQNLTLDPYAGLVYVKTRNVNAGTQDAPKWLKVAEMMPTANGIISINRQLGRVLDFTNPEVKKDATGKVIEVSMSLLLPSPLGPRWEKRTFDESDFMRWRRASHKENGRNKNNANAETLNYANPNYTSWKGGMDPEFARAKCIRHSFKKLGTNPQESQGTVRVHDLPKQQAVVNPEMDEYPDGAGTTDNDVITDYEEINSTLNDQSPDSYIPNSNDL